MKALFITITLALILSIGAAFTTNHLCRRQGEVIAPAEDIEIVGIAGPIEIESNSYVLETKTIKNTSLCDYCGGYVEEKECSISSASCNDIEYATLYIEIDIKGKKVERNICALCFLKVFDTVLGAPLE